MAANEAASELPAATPAEEGSGGVGVAKEESGGDHRPSSPDPCPICLDNVTDAAYTDMCYHRFCFTCLVTWSRVKLECPLCKQRFSLIIHNVRSWADYDQFPVTCPEPPAPTLDASFLISVAFQRPRFRYRTTGGSSGVPIGLGWTWQDMEGNHVPTSANTSLPSSSLSSSFQSNSVVSSNSLSSAVSAPTTFPSPSRTFFGNAVATEWRRRRQVSAVEFRRNIYRQNQWVCPQRPVPGAPQRIRECSPSFFRNNPAQVHRLIPWLHRELLVLLDVRYDYHEVCQMICHAITATPILSARFQAIVWPYLHERSQHFCHEFFHFASSPYDLLMYDLRAEYVRRDPDLVTVPSDHENSDSSDIEIIEPESRNEDPIEISDEDVIAVDARGSDSEASVDIISTLPPLSERTAEIIDLVSDSGSDMDFQHRNPSSTASEPFRSYCMEKRERLRNKHQPFYKDESSSTEEEVPRRKQLRKRKRCSNKPPKKRKRIIENYSSTDEDEERSRSQLNSTSRQTRSKTKPSSSSTPQKRSRSKSSSADSSNKSGYDHCYKRNSPEPSTPRDKSREKRKNSDCLSTPPPPSEVKNEVTESPQSPMSPLSMFFLQDTDMTSSSLTLPGSSCKFSKSCKIVNSKRNSSQPGTSKGKSRDEKSRSSEATSAPASSAVEIKNEIIESFQSSLSPLPELFIPDIISELSNCEKQERPDNYSSNLGFSLPLSSDFEDIELNDQAFNSYSSQKQNTSMKPRLKSVVRKIEPKEEAGCSSWHSHNLRQRSFVYTPYFSTSDSSDW